MPTVSPHYGKLNHGDLSNPRVEMPLKCKACGHTSTYNVGQVIVDPKYITEIDPKNSLQHLGNVQWAKWVTFTGYFVCADCGSGGPWVFTAASSEQMMLMRAPSAPYSYGSYKLM